MAAITSCGKNFYDFLNCCGAVFRPITRQRCFLMPKICFMSQLRSLSAQPVIANNITSTDKHGHTTKKKKPLWYYDNKGIRKRKIDQLMRKSMELNELAGEATTVPDDVKHMRNLLHMFEECDFNKKEVNSLLFNKPKVFGLTKRKVYNCLMDLQDYGYPKSTVKKMILRSPGLLLIDKEISLQKRFTNLQELNLTPKLSHERCIYLVQKCPELLSISQKSVFQSKLKNLHQLGLNPQLIYELVMKFPSVLTYSEKSVKEKVDYITDEIGGRATLFVKFPRAFSASLQRIKERHLYLLKEGFFRGKTIITENKLRAIVLTTDKDFIYRVTNTKMKDYRKFQEELRKEKVEKEFGTTIDKEHDLSNKFKDIDELEYESESEIENEIVQDDREYNKSYMDAFKSKQNVQNDDDFYDTPFPDININSNQQGRKSRSRAYRPMKRRDNGESKFS